MGNVYVFDHPLIQHKTAMIRKKETSVKDFRELVREISMLMGYEATRKLPLEEVKITTPICDTTVNMLRRHRDCADPPGRAGNGRRNVGFGSEREGWAYRTLPGSANP
jgi:uracil phosphoribosyltransferase